MNVFFRVVCSVAGAGAIFAAIGSGLVNDPILGPAPMAREGERRCELDRELSRSHQRFRVMEDLVEELVASNRSLAEAVRESRGLHENDGFAMQNIRRAFGGMATTWPSAATCRFAPPRLCAIRPASTARYCRDWKPSSSNFIPSPNYP